jgi:hypothetical protein
MFLEEGGVELRGWPTVAVAALGAASSNAPHFPQNAFSGGTKVAHDEQTLTASPSWRSLLC